MGVHSVYARFTLLAATAATVSYLIGSLLPLVAAVPAAVTAVVSVRPSFDEGIREASIQVLGTIAGGVIAALLALTFGASPIVLGASVVAAFTIGRMFRLSTDTASTIAVTVIIVVGTHATTDAVWGRLWGVAIGSLVAVLASLYVSPGRAVTRTLDASLRLGHELADRLEQMGAALKRHEGENEVDRDTIQQWLADIEDIRLRLTPVREAADSLVQGSAWSPFTPKAEAVAVRRQVVLTEVAVEQAASMCRDLLITPPNRMPAALIDPIADMFTATAHLLEEQMRLAETRPAAKVDSNDSKPAAVLVEAQQRTLDEARSLDETAPIALGGSLAQDAAKIRLLVSAPDGSNVREPEDASTREAEDESPENAVER